MTAFSDLLVSIEDEIEAWVFQRPSEFRAWVGITALLPVLAVAFLVYDGREVL